jgi:DNA modification methylase
MKIENIKVAGLVPYARNAKRHDEAQVAKIAGSIKEYGFTNPVLIDKDNGIIAGHGRVLAAGRLGLAEVPCIRLAHLTDAQRRAYILADNRLAEIGGGWDLEMLKLELEELDIPLEGIGFGAEDLEELGIDAGLEQTEVDAEPQIDKAAELAEKWGVETGQLWELGDHRLLCGDSTKKEDVERVMGGEKAQTFFIDPPYGDNVGGLETKKASERVLGKGLVKRASFIENDKDIDWLEDVFNLVPPYLEDGSTKMVFCKWDRLEQIKTMAKVWGEPSALCVWDRCRKASAFFRFQPQHEFCWHWGNQSDKKEQSSLSNVWRVPKELELKEFHPTVKPVEIIEPALRVTTEVGKIVLDLFGGSGSIIISAERSGRKCRAIEISPGYVAVAIQRWADATGKEPKRL